MRGEMSIPLIKELVSTLRSIGVDQVLAKRTDGHGLPFSTLRPDGYLSCDLVALEKRFLKGRNES
jgi:hypothetical protein